VAQDRNLLIYAKQMRHAATPFEVILWRHLSRSQLGGHKFRRQHVISAYIVDFFCPEKGLVVEVDGDTHHAAADRERDLALADEGYRTMRFCNAEVRDNLQGVLESILATLEEMPARWDRRQRRPTPCPSPEGEGL
jgi:very-short-patch-repair endonuclease